MQLQYDVIIIGGSYSGLSAAMALGRSLRNVLIIDSGKPCNRFTPHSRNFITHDGAKPSDIATVARQQVLAYPTVQITNTIAVNAANNKNIFTVQTEDGTAYTAKKLLFATGMNDNLPQIDGLADCWGISVIHCPYCHGYEYSHKATGILGNSDVAYHYAMLVSNLTDTLSIYTNGPADFTEIQLNKFTANNIQIHERPLQQVTHNKGYIDSIKLQDGSVHNLTALYVRPNSKQHCTLPQDLGCTISEQGYIVTDSMQKTTLPGIFASGDCCNPMRSVSSAVAQGNMAGAAINAELCGEAF